VVLEQFQPDAIGPDEVRDADAIEVADDGRDPVGPDRPVRFQTSGR